MDAQEKIGSRDILEKLSNEELDSLKETVTKKQIAASGRKGDVYFTHNVVYCLAFYWSYR